MILSIEKSPCGHEITTGIPGSRGITTGVPGSRGITSGVPYGVPLQWLWYHQLVYHACGSDDVYL